MHLGRLRAANQAVHPAAGTDEIPGRGRGKKLAAHASLTPGMFLWLRRTLEKWRKPG
ncbi:hypothetical protein DESPIG_00239 [Desulfovibrio piger ATCC 29098]|uniref:Uncharacterized protein n=1 Tax=Desulfovibrio piger ATCC 29098 TaxID=411464 RepID=B6WQB5_9BACT|nr:hypothetical protein DESPIG_00239 [Desulfovibrio piger ATCC 29098]